MIRSIFCIVFFSYFGMGWGANTYAKNIPTIETCLETLVLEVIEIRANYSLKYDQLWSESENISRQLHLDLKLEKKVSILIRKEFIREEILLLKHKELSEISKIRYLKGLQIIQILYEKMLSLDHHFASVTTLNEINKMTNPNAYPEFIAAKESFKNTSDRKQGFDLSELLGDNIYTSIVHSVVSLFANSNSSKAQKEAKLSEVECILDFTLRMYGDLNTIYFETAFLQKSNQNIMTELNRLFADYTKPIKYKRSLEECRNTDDWSAIREHLANYLKDLDGLLLAGDQRQKTQTMQINLEFPIDRLLQFITQYNAFIDQGGEFYEKFSIMLNSYENAQLCANKIPPEFTTLKNGVEVAVEKFNTAYKPIEINGSKLKEVLYGINEYE